MNLSGEKDDLLDDTLFRNFFEEKIISKNLPENINTLVHGTQFMNNSYDGYSLSYVTVRYLLETKPKQEIAEITKNSEKALELGTVILPEAIDYYKEKFSINRDVKATSKK